MSATRSAAEHPPRLVILDGHGIIFRAYFAVKEPLVVRRSGETVTAVFGFANTLLRVIDELQPTHIAVAMDGPEPTFRHAKDVTYKAHRPPPPADLPAQIERTREVIEAFSIPIFQSPGFEADDVLATLADQAAAQHVETWIATLDSDLLQLVRPGVHVFMYRPYQRDTVRYDTAEKVRDRYGIDPGQMIDFKGLKGDPSDNIAGVPGIGEKTAVALLNAYGDMDGVYAHLDAVRPARAQTALRENRDQAYHSREMATIRHDAPVTLDLDAARVHAYDREKVLHLFQALEFRSLIDRLPTPEAFAGAPEPHVEAGAGAGVYRLLRTAADVEAWLQRARTAPLLAFDLETSEQDAMRCRLAGVSLAVEPGAAVYLPVEHADESGGGLLPLADALRLLRPVLEDAAWPKVAHNAKFDMKVLVRNGIHVRGLAADTMLAAYLLGESAIGLKALAFEKLGVTMTPITALIGVGAKQRSMCDVDAEAAAAYACADADMTLRLFHALQPELEREAGIKTLYETLELPLVDILLRMELRGIAFDAAALQDMDALLETEIAAVAKEIYRAAGHEFNIGSPKQLSEVLFSELGLPPTRRVSHGYSTDAQALERIAEGHPIVEKILHWRELSKLKSTYVDTLPALVHPETGRIHTDYNQTVAATGRLSSENPNLQNIPVRTELGRRIRRAFVPRDGRHPVFVGADYSQIELRVLAHLSGDPGLIAAFQQDEDIHAATASGVYGVPPEQVDPEMRRVAKMMNFGVIYGLTDFGLSQRAGLQRDAAREFIDAYFTRFARVAEWIEEIKASTRDQGYAETLLGRRRYIPEIRSSNFQVRAAAERVAVNMPVQGTAADVIKMAMLKLDRALRERELTAHLLLQVHDELIFEAPRAEQAEVAALLRAIMPSAIEMVVPLKVEVKAGPNWGEMAPLPA